MQCDRTIISRRHRRVSLTDLKRCRPLQLPRHRCQDRTVTDVPSRCSKSFMAWVCPQCDRTFRRVNQRHACGVGIAATLLTNRPPALADLYRKLETTVKGFGDADVVTHNR